jgi:hypothetical protein
MNLPRSCSLPVPLDMQQARGLQARAFSLKTVPLQRLVVVPTQPRIPVSRRGLLAFAPGGTSSRVWLAQRTSWARVSSTVFASLPWRVLRCHETRRKGDMCRKEMLEVEYLGL